MSRMIFVNLAVNDVEESRTFFTRLGFEFNAEFSDEKALCMVVADNIFVMLLQRDYFKTFLTGEVADTSRGTEVLNGLSATSRAEVDELVGRAIEAGGKPWRDPVEEGPMYGWSFQDLDGHVWELMYMEQPA